MGNLAGRPIAEELTARCSARSKQTGEQCRQPAMPGTTVCYYHGGAGVAGAIEANTKHGDYAAVRYVPAVLKERYEAAQADPDLLRTEHRIALAQAVFDVYASNFEYTSRLSDEEANSLLSKVERISTLIDRHHARTHDQDNLLTETKVAVWIAQVAAAVQSALMRHVSNASERDACIAEIRRTVADISVGGVSRRDAAPSV